MTSTTKAAEDVFQDCDDGTGATNYRPQQQTLLTSYQPTQQQRVSSPANFASRVASNFKSWGMVQGEQKPEYNPAHGTNVGSSTTSRGWEGSSHAPSTGFGAVNQLPESPHTEERAQALEHQLRMEKAKRMELEMELQMKKLNIDGVIDQHIDKVKSYYDERIRQLEIELSNRQRQLVKQQEDYEYRGAQAEMQHQRQLQQQQQLSAQAMGSSSPSRFGTTGSGGVGLFGGIFGGNKSQQQLLDGQYRDVRQAAYYGTGRDSMVRGIHADDGYNATYHQPLGTAGSAGGTYGSSAAGGVGDYYRAGSPSRNWQWNARGQGRYDSQHAGAVFPGDGSAFDPRNNSGRPASPYRGPSQDMAQQYRTGSPQHHQRHVGFHSPSHNVMVGPNGAPIANNRGYNDLSFGQQPMMMNSQMNGGSYFDSVLNRVRRTNSFRDSRSPTRSQSPTSLRRF